jgi:neutral ceramidase
MLGYGMHFHKIEGVETPQYVRAFVIATPSKKLVFVNADFCFSTSYLKARVVRQLALNHADLGFNNANIMITAQHTHSAAGGYTQHLAYNFTMPGFQEAVYLKYSDAIIEAIVKADRAKKPGHIKHHDGQFDKEAEVCFNRSVRAYNKNPEVGVKVPLKKRHLAADRNMKLLRFDDTNNQTIGSINWFGVHTTSVSNRYRKVCYDNKGYAADYFEQYLASTQTTEGVTAFAQDATGDISPNFIWDRKNREYRGKFEDDYESAAYNGQLQFEKARDIYQSAAKIGKKIEGGIDYIMMYADMSDVSIDADYTGGLKHETTAQATWGMSFLEGTTDGQGATKIMGNAVRMILGTIRSVEVLAARMSKDPQRQRQVMDYYNAHHPKAIIINHETGVTAGAVHPEKLVVPGFIDPSIKFIKFANKVGYGKKTPWVPKRLPLQIFVIGQLAIVGIPAEITTIAAKRLRKTVAKVLEERGVSEVILSPYANSYAGYITTYEEYRLQLYEGGHTLFGKWTLAAYQMKFKALAEELLKKEEDRTDLPQNPTLFGMEDIWTGMQDLGILAELEDAENNLIKGMNEEE